MGEVPIGFIVTSKRCRGMVESISDITKINNCATLYMKTDDL